MQSRARAAVLNNPLAGLVYVVNQVAQPIGGVIVPALLDVLGVVAVS